MNRLTQILLFVFCFVSFFAVSIQGGDEGAEKKVKPKSTEIDIDDRKWYGENHPVVDLYVGRQDSICWHSAKPFRVLSFNPKDEDKKARADEWYPFYRPLETLISEIDDTGRHVISTGPLRKDKESLFRYGQGRSLEKGVLFEPVFEFLDSGDKMDPHIAVHAGN